MLELIIAASLLGDTAETEQPSHVAPAVAGQKAASGQPKAWTMPKLDYSGSGCEQFVQRPLDGFGDMKVGTPCPTRPAEAASKGRSVGKRN